MACQISLEVAPLQGAQIQTLLAFVGHPVLPILCAESKLIILPIDDLDGLETAVVIVLYANLSLGPIFVLLLVFAQTNDIYVTRKSQRFLAKKVTFFFDKLKKRGWLWRTFNFIVSVSPFSQNGINSRVVISLTCLWWIQEKRS